MTYDLRGIFQKLETELKTNPTESLASVAAKLGVSGGTVRRAVRLAKGCTYAQHRRELALAAAVRALREAPDKSIKEVAVALGFPSERALRRFLKRGCGETPLAIRRWP